MSTGNQVLGPGPLDPHGNSIINESMWDAVFPLLDAHFLQVSPDVSVSPFPLIALTSVGQGKRWELGKILTKDLSESK